VIRSLRCILVLSVANLTTLVRAEPAATKPTPWRTLAPIPNPIGFGGMFAGVCEDGLFAGGGSQFVGGPSWQGGEKFYSDKVYFLPALDGSWRELPDRLPEPRANAACAPHGNAVIAAGGVNATGPLRSVVKIGIHKGDLSVESLPPLPHPLVYASAAVVRDVFYVVGGVPDAASKETSQECWALPLTVPPGSTTSAGWIRLPDLPGRAGIVMATGADDHGFYVFGGAAFLPPDGETTPTIPLDNAYRYDPASSVWIELADVPAPRVGAATPVPRLPDGSFFLAGGYGFIFVGEAKNHPGFDPETFLYSPSKNLWTNGPPFPRHRTIDPEKATSPGPEPVISSPAVLWHNQVVIISGEVRPSIRTPAVVAIPVSAVR